MNQRATESLDRAVEWLLSQQSKKDGGWHSDTYGAMRGGASSTSLVLYTAGNLPEEQRARPEWKRGFEFLLPGLAKRNCVACPDGTLDYPTYSTAMTLIATRRFGWGIAADKRAELVDYLVTAQLQGKNGFAPDQVDYGGWDLIGASGAKGVTSGTNISVSYFAVKALSGEAHAAKDETLKRAIAWCKRCQNWPTPEHDGGFFFHPDRNALGNKAAWSDEDYKHPRSYGTATCDGINLLLSAGGDESDKRIVAAKAWLHDRPDTDKVPGFEKEAETADLQAGLNAQDDLGEGAGWEEGLKFYFFLSLSRVLPRLPKEVRTKRKDGLLEELIGLQEKDGRWENESARMREDDPLIATCFSLVALSNLLRAK